MANMEVEESPTIKVNLLFNLERELESEHARMCLIGSMFGPRPSMEILKRWMDETWGPLGALIKMALRIYC